VVKYNYMVNLKHLHGHL